MATLFISIALVSFLLISVSRKSEKIFACVFSFFLIQFLLSLYTLFRIDEVENSVFYTYFLADRLSLIMFLIISVVGLISSFSSFYCIKDKIKIYFSSFIFLDLLLLGVVFSNNLIVSWIFLEATTLAVAIISYHDRNSKAIEATWKYIFISSIGIALAYLGILLLGHESSIFDSSLSYPDLKSISSQISPVIFEISFLLIFIGYSSKLEVIPLYTPSIDINHASPTPSSGFISSALVGATFVSIFRLYGVLSPNSEVFEWAKHVMIVVGVISVACTAVYAGRTDNYKRLLSYSTVENCGLVMLGLGIGGIGICAALIHMFVHMILKCIAFAQMAIVGNVYGTYKIGMQSEYYKVDPVGSAVIILALISLMAFPPSVLFRTEMMIFSEMVVSGQLWWVLIILMIMLIAVIYWMFEKILPLLYKRRTHELSECNYLEKRVAFSIVMLVILFALFIAGWFFPEAFTSFLIPIANV